MSTRLNALNLTEAEFVGLFFAVLPFAYFFQVITGVPELAIVVYFPLIVALVVKGIEWQTVRDMFFRNGVSFLVLFLAARNAISGAEALLSGNMAIAGRIFIIFVLPVGVYFLVSAFGPKQLWKLVTVIALGAAVIAVEMFFENIHVRLFHEPTLFQLMNHDYVLARTGRDLSQLYYYRYRPTGLLEHVHATVFYSCIGLLAWLALYLAQGRGKYLILAGICEVAVMAHGVRLAVAICCVAIGILFYLVRPSGNDGRWRISLGSLIFLCVAFLVLDPLGTVREFYVPVVMHGDFQNGDSQNGDSQNGDSQNGDSQNGNATPEGIIFGGTQAAVMWMGSQLEGGWKSSSFYTGLFGQGLEASLTGSAAGLNDDFFIGQLFVQYGLVGGAMYLGLWPAALLGFGAAFQRAEREDKILLAFSLAVVVLLGLSLLHSGVMQKKAIFPVFLLALAIIQACRRRSELMP